MDVEWSQPNRSVVRFLISEISSWWIWAYTVRRFSFGHVFWNVGYCSVRTICSSVQIRTYETAQILVFLVSEARCRLFIESWYEWARNTVEKSNYGHGDTINRGFISRYVANCTKQVSFERLKTRWFCAFAAIIISTEFHR